MSNFSTLFVKSLLEKIFPNCLRKTQLVNLSLGVLGIAKARSGILSEIVRETPGAAKHGSRLKRLWRFVSNHRLKPERLFGFWIAWCVAVFTPGKYLPLAIDWTGLPGRLACLMIAIPYHGRGIPLIWQIVPNWTNIKDSQNKIEERLLTRLLNLLPEGKRVIILADRGFGRATFIEFLLGKNVLFSIRVRADVWIKTRKGKNILLRKLYLKPRKPYWFKRIEYRNDGLVKGVNLAAILIPPPDLDRKLDPWFLVTNLRRPETTIARYETRFQIEEWFKDIKHQLGITKLQTRNLKRIRRILFIACLSYGILMLVGNLAVRFTTWKERLISKRNQACSRIWLALKIIQYQLAPSFFWKRVWVKGRGP